jgi:hypothetical protein
MFKFHVDLVVVATRIQYECFLRENVKNRGLSGRYGRKTGQNALERRELQAEL